MGSVEEFVAN